MVHWRWEKSWLVCQCEEGDLNDVYVVAVKTDWLKAKLAHSLVIFPACLISHFVMNIIIWLTDSTTKVIATNCHIFSNAPKYLSGKIPAIRYEMC